MNSRRPSLPPHDEAIEAMAAAWLAQRDDGLTTDEQADFARWQQADPRHAAAVTRLEKTWTALQQLREFRPESRVHPNRDLLAGTRPPAKIISFPAAAALAGLAAAVALAAFTWWPRPAPSPVAAPVYATTADGYQRVTLEDGSVLELNANSLARVLYTPEQRRVELERGEAHFTVAKNPRRPFIVRAGTVAVRAVGTAFNVRLAGHDVEVLVTEGRVKIENHAPGLPATDGSRELGVGECLVVPAQPAAGTAAARAELLPPEAVQAALAWQGPRLRFNETPLADVVTQFNRHNRIQIELADASLAGLPVDGSFRSENVEAFIRLLESDRTIRVERAAPDRIILHHVP